MSYICGYRGIYWLLLLLLKYSFILCGMALFKLLYLSIFNPYCSYILSELAKAPSSNNWCTYFRPLLYTSPQWDSENHHPIEMDTLQAGEWNIQGNENKSLVIWIKTCFHQPFDYMLLVCGTNYNPVYI